MILMSYKQLGSMHDKPLLVQQNYIFDPDFKVVNWQLT